VSDSAVVLEGVGKRYSKLEERATLLRSLIPFRRPKRSDFWALRGIDFKVGAGETVGIIGRNGAGKTTLLRMLAGVSAPSEGRLRVTGRIAPLIGVGVGFHKEMSGRENVFVNGMILGLSEAEVRERFDAIVEFAELGDFIDVPVKFYSSGMFMRLGFAVAVHTDPQVLLVDEVLAVGDSAFQMKCLERMRSIQQSGTTIVMVSHSMHAIRLLCPRTIVMRRGHMEFDGETELAVARHHELLSQDAGEEQRGRRDAHDQRVSGGATIETASIVDEDGAPVHYAVPDQDLRLRLRVRFDRAVDHPLFAFNVLAEDGSVAYGLQSPVSFPHRSYGAGETADVELRFRAHLGGGSFRASATVATSDGRQVLAADPTGVLFYVEPRNWAYGTADLDGTVVVDGQALVDDRAYRLGE
jgi:ABC-type polysaccharide/polyol phosphate transport system ATPase subunit